MITWVKANPTRAAAVGAIVIGWLGLVGVPNIIVGGLSTILAIILGGPVWGSVNTITKTVQATTEAATAAATAAVERLDESGVGAVGQVTATGANVVAGVVDDVTTVVLSGLGFSRKDRQAQ